MTDRGSLLDLVTSQLQGGDIDAIARQAGIDSDSAMKVVAGALPALLSGLAKNTQDSAGASALADALDRDHDGSVLENVAGFLGSAGATNTGAGILRHVLGSRQGSMEAALGQMSGIDAGSAGQILAMVAPLLMGLLGREKRSRALDAGGLADLLGAEREVATQRAPQAMDMLGGLLDTDGDGQVADDLADLGGSLLGGLFGRPK
jgi:hypothetical protein